MGNETNATQGSSAPAGPRRYMSKTQRACDFCRSRKSACRIDAAPPCHLCVAHGRPCEFTDRVVRRKLLAPQQRLFTSPTYTRGDEGDNSRDLSHRQAASSLSPMQNLSFGPLTDGPFDLSPPGIGDSIFTFEPEGIEVASSFPSGSDHDMMHGLLLGIYGEQRLPGGNSISDSTQRPLADNPSLSLQLCGLTGDMDPYVLQHYKFDGNGEFPFSKLTLRTVQSVDVPVQFLLSKPDVTAELKSQTRLVDPENTDSHDELFSVVSPEIGERLIRLFLKFINPQFPIFSEGNLPNAASAPVCLLAGIYLITQPFTTFDDYLCIELVYSPPPPHVLFRIAWRALNEALSEPTIASVQAALILLLQPATNPLLLDSTLKWSLLGTTVSMAQTLGLHLDPSSWKLPMDEIRTRRRLSWTVYVLDKWLAFSFGRPSHISRNDWLVTELAPEDVSDGLSGSNTESYAFVFSKLTVILDTVLTNLYSLRSVATLSKSFSLTMSNARPIMQELTSWHASLPPCFTMEPKQNNSGDSPDSSASLHIAFQSIKILVLRALLRPFNGSHREDSDEWRAARAHTRNTAFAEAEVAVVLVSSLRPVHYQAFWAPWTKTCFALITHILFLLAVTAHHDRESSEGHRDRCIESPGGQAGSDDEYSRCREALDRARAVFRLHGKSLDVIRFALLRIDAVFWVGWEKVVGFA